MSETVVILSEGAYNAVILSEDAYNAVILSEGAARVEGSLLMNLRG